MASGTAKIHSSIRGGTNTFPDISGTIGKGVPIGDKQIFQNTTAYWNSHIDIVSKKDCIYVYSDYTIKDGVDIPAIKVGDGTTYVVDLPFTNMGNVTPEEIAYWNNKVTAFINPDDPANLVFSKD